MSTATTPAPPVPAPMRLGRRRASRTTARALKLAAIVFFAVLVLTPLYVAVITSFKEAAETDPAHAWSLPTVWTLDAWHQAWDQLSPNLANTFKLVIPATVISTILGSLNGFVLSKWRFPGANIVFTLFLFGLFIPYQAVMIPLTTLLADIHFPDQIPRLAFAHIVYGIPITTLIFRSYYATIPEELMEAARMDRAGMLRTYWSVVSADFGPGVRGDRHLAVHVDLERLSLCRLHHQRSGQVARDGRRQQRRRLDGLELQPADVGRVARVAADARRLHPPRPLLRARADGRGAEGLTVAEIVLEHLTKRFANGVEAVKDLSLEIPDEKLLVLVGPSGCGKTTALRMIAGLEDISSGDLYIGGRRMNDVLERDRDIAMVFQNYALYPHMSVAQNIGFSLKLSRRPRKEVRQRVRETAELLGLEDLLDRRPKQLSGGQRQRVAMGRAIIREPQAFLMDEPLSNLDAQLRVQMRGEIEALQKRLGVTTVYVTHDQVEAMTMGDHIAVLREGVLQQVGHPTHVYDNPGEPLRRRVHRLAADEPRPGNDRDA